MSSTLSNRAAPGPVQGQPAQSLPSPSRFSRSEQLVIEILCITPVQQFHSVTAPSCRPEDYPSLVPNPPRLAQNTLRFARFRKLLEAFWADEAPVWVSGNRRSAHNYPQDDPGTSLPVCETVASEARSFQQMDDSSTSPSSQSPTKNPASATLVAGQSKKAKADDVAMLDQSASSSTPSSPAAVPAASGDAPSDTDNTQIPPGHRAAVHITSSKGMLDQLLAFKCLQSIAQLQEDKIRQGIRADMILLSKDKKSVTIALQASAHQLYGRIKKAQDNNVKFPQFTYNLITTSTTLEDKVVEPLFITFGYSHEPDVVAAAVAERIGANRTFVTARRGPDSKITTDKFVRTYYIVNVPPSHYKTACGAVITVNNFFGQHTAMLAPSVKAQYGAGLRRFRFTLGSTGDVDIETPVFVRFFEFKTGCAAKYWDRGRRDDGTPTSTISIATEPDSALASYIVDKINKFGTSEGEVDGLNVTFKIAEITKEQYEANEESRRGGHSSPNGKKKPR